MFPIDLDRVTLDIDPRASSSEAVLIELRHGLRQSPPRLPSKLFYDRRGSELFEQITHLPEYYLTRAEHLLLAQVGERICRETEAQELVELGAGSAQKTRLLLDAIRRCGKLRRYVPFDVSESQVRRVAKELTSEYPDLIVHGIVADFVDQLRAIPEGETRLVILLGSTIGNFSAPRAQALLARIGGLMRPDDFFLLGADLIKDVARLEAAYNDSLGVTAEFNRNILNVVNRVAQADFDRASFDHRAFYNKIENRIEMHLVASHPQRVRLEALDLELRLDAGHSIRTEISCKYNRRMITDLLEVSGFEPLDWYTDCDELFALALARRAGYRRA